ncbi:MurR/RpiR family transcriptional regulator [Microbacterium sp. H1-D42]|uniref:MurR/RpiR family transcriptional regulator n=1 Tax=Microbacterium sp. H1-D42 TaxID=2925844 RepID=UPI001F53624B|nr:MurR/RpiR family transcriptional regulator [Microbacterium sp. H1-D42]UNK70348.1 MurR/RpiR family transcriptional regulator [Microbacterium sp. H1-D42]
MNWHGSSDAPPLARIAALTPSLQPGERRVTEAIMADRGATVERTAQELADAVGVGRTTVIRAAQSLGYEGYPQLRVALAQELALESVDTGEADGTMLGAVRAGVSRFAARLSNTAAALTEDDVQQFMSLLDRSQRVLVLANGLSGSLGIDLVLRLNSAGRPAEILMDALSQQISARQLGPDSLCVVISGSGANRSTLEGIGAAKKGGAKVVAITSFARSAVADAADVALVVPPINESFQDELIHTSRAALMLLIELLVEQFVVYRGERGREAQAAALSMLGGGILE